MKRNRIALTISVLLILTGTVPAATALSAPLVKASFIPQWVPQAQFAGYYLALEKGFYEKEGIDLTIIQGGPANPPTELLEKGRADFALFWLSTGIQLRAQGTKVVNIAQMIQRSSLMLIAKKSSGILHPENMQGKKVGLWGPIFQIQPQAFFRKYNLDVHIVPQSYSVNLFLRDGVDVASAMWYNEYHTILNSGFNPDELTTFFFHEHGLNFPEDGIYVLEEYLEKNPEVCRAFVAASIEGWLYAFAHPDEAVSIVMKNLANAHIPATAVHQKWMLDRMKDLTFPDGMDGRSMGTLLPEEYYRVAMGLKREGLIDSVPVFTFFYRGSFE